MEFSRASDVFDLYIDWQRRLAREIPFLQKILSDGGARSVADVACGSGQHAIALAKLGFRVTGIDPDRSLLDRARAAARAEEVEVEWIEASFSDLERHVARGGQRYDAIVCVGNSLALVDGDELPRALSNLAGLLSPGGVLVLHTINFPRLAARDEDPWGPVRCLADGSLLLKGFVPRGAEPWDVIFVSLSHDERKGWTRKTHRFRLFPHATGAIEKGGLRAGLEMAGLFGGFCGERPDAEGAADLVYVFKAIRRPSTPGRS